MDDVDASDLSMMRYWLAVLLWNLGEPIEAYPRCLFLELAHPRCGILYDKKLNEVTLFGCQIQLAFPRCRLSISLDPWDFIGGVPSQPPLLLCGALTRPFITPLPSNKSVGLPDDRLQKEGSASWPIPNPPENDKERAGTILGNGFLRVPKRRKKVVPSKEKKTAPANERARQGVGTVVAPSGVGT